MIDATFGGGGRFREIERERDRERKNRESKEKEKKRSIKKKTNQFATPTTTTTTTNNCDFVELGSCGAASGFETGEKRDRWRESLFRLFPSSLLFSFRSFPPFPARARERESPRSHSRIYSPDPPSSLIVSNKKQMQSTLTKFSVFFN